ncbi:hypothetical protein [Occultella kanbiaonis]|uniref:hypothetical protein n=1 Tax=Occultella kanbiaonis TaxID=2675754 RepID=UPI0013D39427|nr:hypothetical protein [Occultella kanbiaonis]
MVEPARGDRVRSLAGLAVGAGGSLVTAVASPRGTRWRWAAVAVVAPVVVLVLRPAVGSLDVLWLG